MTTHKITSGVLTTHASTLSSSQKYFWVTLMCAAILLIVHWVVPRLRKMDDIDDGVLNSIGGGLALGYVFLHALPGLVLNLTHLQQMATTFFLQNERNLLFTIFMFALLGFFVTYVLEKLAHDRTKMGREPGAIIYYGHLASLIFLSFSIAMLLPMMAHHSYYGLALFTFVMAFHFVLEDHSMSHHFPTRFNRTGRYLAMFAIVCGWIYGLYYLPAQGSLSASFINAFIAGTLILSTTKTEFTLLEGRSHFPTFVASLSAKAVIVLIMILLENIQ